MRSKSWLLLGLTAALWLLGLVILLGMKPIKADTAEPAHNTVLIDVTDPLHRVRHRLCQAQPAVFTIGDHLILATDTEPRRRGATYRVIDRQYVVADSTRQDGTPCWTLLRDGSQLVYIVREN